MIYENEVDVMGVDDDLEYMGMEDEAEDILQGMSDEDVLDDLENYPEIMGEYLPEIMGKRKRRGFLSRLAARRRKKMKRRIAKMSPKRKKRWQRIMKMKKRIFKKLKRFKKLIPMLIPGSMVSKAIIRRKMKRRKAGKRGLIGRLVMRKFGSKRGRRRISTREVRRQVDTPEPVDEATRSYPHDVVQPSQQEVRREIQPAAREVQQEEEPQPIKKAGFDKKLLIPLAAAAVAIPLLMKKK